MNIPSVRHSLGQV